MPFWEDSGQQIISKVVTSAISTLFKSTAKLEATVKAKPVSKLWQGSIDGFDLIGDRLMMYNNLCIEGMELYFQAISIDFGLIFQGKVKLRQPIQGSMRVVFTQKDLNIAFNSEFVLRQLQKMQFRQQPVQFKDVQLVINQNNSLAIKIIVMIVPTQEMVNLDLQADLSLENRTKIQFINVRYQSTQPAQDLGKALIHHINNLLDLDKIALDGTRLRVDRVKVKNQQIIFYGVTDIYRFPDKINI